VLNYTSEFDHATWQLLQWIHRGEVKVGQRYLTLCWCYMMLVTILISCLKGQVHC